MPSAGASFLLGVSGAGKTHAAQVLSDEDDTFAVFRGGVRLRKIALQDPKGSVARAMAAGEPVSPSDFLHVVDSAAAEFEGQVVLFDGFPRSLEQARAVPDIMRILNIPDPRRVLFVEVGASRAETSADRRNECPACGRVEALPFFCERCQRQSDNRSAVVDRESEAARIAQVIDFICRDFSFRPASQTDEDGPIGEAIAAHFAPFIASPNGRPELLRHQAREIVRAIRLHHVRRFFHQRYFEQETQDAEYASRVESFPRLESVSEHSWHVADTVEFLSPWFPEIDLGRAMQLAVAHDKLEMFIGDIDPIGRDGTGEHAHAFNLAAQDRKRLREQGALESYLRSIPLAARSLQRSIHREAMQCMSKEARFVKSIDKLVAIAYIIAKKRGGSSDKQLRMLYNLTERNVSFYPNLGDLHWTMYALLLDDVAQLRGVSIGAVRAAVERQQPLLFD